MSTNWYYVDGNERIGPLEEPQFKSLFQEGVLNESSYVWKKGFDNWKKAGDVTEILPVLQQSKEDMAQEQVELEVEQELDSSNREQQTEPDEQAEQVSAQEGIDWNDINENERIFTIKIGVDRGAAETEYGPFSISMLQRLAREKRVNAKTFIYTPGMSDWEFMADIPLYEAIFDELPPKLEEQDKRSSSRKPFVARMLFHDNSIVYEGVCRDISVGGLQILVSDVPVEVGNDITMNVHPDNSEQSFVAVGKVVRLLDGNQGFSIRFQNLNDEAKTIIEDYTRE